MRHAHLEDPGVDERALDTTYRTSLVIWGGLLGGVTMLALVTLGLVSGVFGSAWTATLDGDFVATALLGVVGLLGAGLLFRRREPKLVAMDPAARLGAYQTHVIVASAIQEGAGLFGIVLGLLAGQASWIAGVWLLTAFAMVLSRPSRDELERVVRRGR